MGFLALFYPEMKALCGLKVIENIFDFTGGNFNVKNCWKKSTILHKSLTGNLQILYWT